MNQAMTLKFTAALFSTLLFVNCQNKSTHKASITKDTLVSTQIDSAKIATQDSTEEVFPCARGAAESVVKEDYFQNATFKLNDDKRTGIETMDLKNGDKLMIRNGGCEYYVLTFRFETERFKADTTDLKYWMEKAAVLMHEIEGGLDTPLDITGGVVAMENLLREDKEYLPGQEIVSRPGDMRSFTTFERVQRISDKKFAIEISFGTGPL